jgi:two-component system nitrate/nitrite response regulator NarL
MLVLGLLLDLEETINTVTKIKAWGPTSRIVILAEKLDIEAMTTCFAAGASGYLLHTISRDALRDSLLLVSAGEKVFPSELASALPIIFGSPLVSNLAPPDRNLSPREIEILECLRHGQSNKVIARSLDIAEGTVKVHVKRIMRKAGVANRTQAALWGKTNAVTSELDIAVAQRPMAES